MKKLSDKARMYARSYGQPPYREIEGTAELLLQIADRLDEYEVLEKQGKILRLPCALGDTVYHLCTLKWRGESRKMSVMRRRCRRYV